MRRGQTRIHWKGKGANEGATGSKKEGVRRARSEEMAEVKKHNVYVKVPISQCWDSTGKEPIGTRWVDTANRSTGLD